MKQTLLAITQDILGAMGSDEVNSISDTTESMDVVREIRMAYVNFMEKRDWPSMRLLSSLEGLASLGQPTTMRIPDTLTKVFWVKYNGRPVDYVDPTQFNDLIGNRIGSYNADPNGFATTVGPTYWTSYDDEYIIFDAYNASEESTMQQSNSLVYGVKAPVWEDSDDFVLPVPTKFFPAIIADATSSAFINIKQSSNPKQEARAKDGKTRLQNEAVRIKMAESRYNTKVNYGRKR